MRGDLDDDEVELRQNQTELHMTGALESVYRYLSGLLLLQLLTHMASKR